MELIDKDVLVAEIESKFQKYYKRGEESDVLQDGNDKYWGGVLSCLNEVKTLVNTLEVKEVDLDALGVLAKHLIACDAHGITPKYSDRELDFLEGLANEAQKGE